ncbi:hypothetical protein EV356DRAFT_81693 [Viridothelium virens]|uniref:Uncharacterized protein n=1 Tax=Viridothelium virens TaxID=1048519 RepID=A0A6A6HET8_VIRVR|nr:hypothetical protein EV356DRAFT_81693 [Viridothelium virens]
MDELQTNARQNETVSSRGCRGCLGPSLTSFRPLPRTPFIVDPRRMKEFKAYSPRDPVDRSSFIEIEQTSATNDGTGGMAFSPKTLNRDAKTCRPSPAASSFLDGSVRRAVRGKRNPKLSRSSILDSKLQSSVAQTAIAMRPAWLHKSMSKVVTSNRVFCNQVCAGAEFGA